MIDDERRRKGLDGGDGGEAKTKLKKPDYPVIAVLGFNYFLYLVNFVILET